MTLTTKHLRYLLDLLNRDLRAVDSYHWQWRHHMEISEFFDLLERLRLEIGETK